ncbi:hypothetical protein [Tropicimonas sp. IMCC6043]|uniref:hypothetical protein n=1 Tax=Tropicimonas sp. IMCC6043 TaxID=2510645 RepID=UPI00101D2336|nr:hypothetical protein [Tropicimonas sp. IMCC6043]RYH06611.1 hypothetical protein EU800_23230 [Tropicimonas sp. IMCC6043]
MVQNLVLRIGLAVLAAAVYSAYVFTDWSTVDDLMERVPAFTISALAIGVTCSVFNFSKPLLTTFLISAPAPVLSILGYTLVAAAIAGANDVIESAVNLAIFFSFFSIFYALLAMLGCVIGIRLRNWLKTYLSRTWEVHGGDEVTAAKISAGVTFVSALIVLAGTVLTVVFGE